MNMNLVYFCADGVFIAMERAYREKYVIGAIKYIYTG